MFALIRIAGSIGISRGVGDTMHMLRLRDVNNCVLVEDKPELRGMIQRCKDFITYGEIDKETLMTLLKKRLRLAGNKRVDEKVLKDVTGFDSFEKFADELIAEKIKLRDFENVIPVFRLTPPSKGFKSTREHYPKGDLGYRGKEINELLKRMI